VVYAQIENNRHAEDNTDSELPYEVTLRLMKLRQIARNNWPAFLGILSLLPKALLKKGGRRIR